MAFLTSGGSSVTSANIVDGEIVNADISPSAGIVQSKIAAQANANADIVSVEIGSATPYSLTTVAGQRVLVIASFNLTGGAGACTVDLQYNGVTKHSIASMNNATTQGNCMMYSEVPGAATANITIVPSAGSVSNPRITVIKFKG
jgi:hypothetical protein